MRMFSRRHRCGATGRLLDVPDRQEPGGHFLVDRLEARTLLSAVYPTTYEQYLVELYNRARADPLATAARYGIDLNEGPPASGITSTPKQPLAINPNLMDSARGYAQWVIDTDAPLDHIGADGSSWEQRMIQAGYVLSGAWGDTENAALSITSWFYDTKTLIDGQFAGLYTDVSVPGRWHRINMMNDSVREIGSGIALGDYGGALGFVSVQDLAFSSASGVFLTGVAYSDTSHDNFYSPGEQMGAVTVTAIRASDGARFTTTTWDSGGYSLALPNGSYTVWGSGGGLVGYVRYDDVTIAGQNVKRDFRPDFVGTDPGPDGTAFATLINGTLSVRGTSANDTVSILGIGGAIFVTLNGANLGFSTLGVEQITAATFEGNDSVTITLATTNTIPASVSLGEGNDSLTVSSSAGASVFGGGGDDTISTSSGDDSVSGDAGNDSINSAGGNDTILGGDGDDRLNGGDDADLIWGGDGKDYLWGGGGADVLHGDAGNDTLAGQADDDTLDGGAGADNFLGGLGNDTADYSTRVAPIVVTLGSRYDAATDGEAGENDNIFDDIETVLAGSGNDSIVGSAYPNLLSGNVGNDTITGGSGADTILGGDNDDVIYARDGTPDYVDGGPGIDSADYDSFDSVVGVESRRLDRLALRSDLDLALVDVIG